MLARMALCRYYSSVVLLAFGKWRTPPSLTRLPKAFAPHRGDVLAAREQPTVLTIGEDNKEKANNVRNLINRREDCWEELAFIGFFCFGDYSSVSLAAATFPRAVAEGTPTCSPQVRTTRRRLTMSAILLIDGKIVGKSLLL